MKKLVKLKMKLKIKKRRVDGVVQGYNVKHKPVRSIVKPGVKKKHVIAFSGGKDSAAMLLRMIELNMPIDKILFCDTGKEFPDLYKFVEKMSRYTKKTIGVSVTTLKPVKTWDDWFFGKITRGKSEGKIRGWPLMAFHCWWSREAKFKLMDPICIGNFRYIGFGADEKKRVIAGKTKEGYTFPLDDWGWTENDALEYLKDKGWAMQYHLDFDRTGCHLCPKQKERSLRTLARKYPVEWKELMYYAKAAQDKNFASHKFTPAITYQKLLQIQLEETKNRGDKDYENKVHIQKPGHLQQLKTKKSLKRINGK